MNRVGNLYSKICSIENLRLAESKARKGKTKQRGVILHDKNREANILALHKMLVDKTYHTSEYHTFTIEDPKKRIVYRLPFKDRIVHHAIMNVLKPIFVSTFTKDTYSCIEGRGVHEASNALRFALRDVEGTKYCLKLDIKKFYPSIDHDILKALLRRKIKDADVLWLLDDIIDSAPGVPIGNYLSQYFANFYLAYFDHWIKEKMGVLNYFRYCDDMVLPSSNKPYLHRLLFHIREYLDKELKLTIKDNYQIFLTDSRGIDAFGYKHFHEYVLLRKGIKKNFARAVARRKTKACIAPYNGWAKHCDSKHLMKKLAA